MEGGTIISALNLPRPFSSHCIDLFHLKNLSIYFYSHAAGDVRDIVLTIHTLWQISSNTAAGLRLYPSIRSPLCHADAGMVRQQRYAHSRVH